MLKYVNGLAEATANLERFPRDRADSGAGADGRYCGTAIRPAVGGAPRCENGWFVVELCGSADAAQKLYLLLTREPSFPVWSMNNGSGSVAGQFAIRCELKDDQGVLG